LGPWPVPGSTLARCRNSQAWGLELLPIDPDPGAKLGPGVAHNLELCRNGQQLGA